MGDKRDFRWDKPFTTASGTAARLLCNLKTISDYKRAVVYVDRCGDERVEPYTEDGRYYNNIGAYHEYDLVNVKTKKSGWINVYPKSVYDNSKIVSTSSAIFASQDEADKGAAPNRLDCARIYWEE